MWSAVLEMNIRSTNVQFRNVADTSPVTVRPPQNLRARNWACRHTGEGEDIQPRGEPPAYSIIHRLPERLSESERWTKKKK